MPKPPQTRRRLTSSFALSLLLGASAGPLISCESPAPEEETRFDALLCRRPPPAVTPEEAAPPDRTARLAQPSANTCDEVLEHEASIAHIEAAAQLDQEFNGATP